MKIHSVGTTLLHAGRRTHMTKLTVAFRNFQNAPDKTQHHKAADCNTDLKTLHYMSLFFPRI